MDSHLREAMLAMFGMCKLRSQDGLMLVLMNVRVCMCR